VGRERRCACPSPTGSALRRLRTHAILLAVIAAFAAPSAWAEDLYTAPDARVLNRTFAVAPVVPPRPPYLPKPRIVVCSDDPSSYIGAIQRFADYVFAETPFAVVDGRAAPLDLDFNTATFVYIGQLPEGPEGRACLSRFPELATFFDETSNMPRTIDLGLVTAKASLRGVTSPTIAANRFDRRETSKFDNRVHYCFDEQFGCASDLVTSLFALELFCSENPGACGRLFPE